MNAALEFFAGIGLVRLALRNAGWNVVFANDIEPKKHEIYKANFGSRDFKLGDIADLKASKLPSAELATASFPCIDLSLAGNRAGLNGHHSSVFWHFYRLLVEMRQRSPRYVLIENVTGLLSSHAGKDLKAILEALNAKGYFCDLLVIDAANFVPQSRQRLFILGDRESEPSGAMPFPRHPARSEAVLRFMASFPKLKWHHFDLPPLPNRSQDLADVLERFDPTDPVWWDEERRQHLADQISPVHALRLRHLTVRDDTTFVTVYKRVRPSGCRAELRFDGVAGCLRTPRGGKQQAIRHLRWTWDLERAKHDCQRIWATPGSS